MRAATATDALTSAVRTHFAADVADVITSDQDMFDQCARWVVGHVSDPDQLYTLIAALAQDTADSTRDWLVESADSPAGWFYSRLTSDNTH
jgi:hypothetical protein